MPTPAPKPELMWPVDCPPDVEQLGSATRTFLHMTAAYYPERLSMQRRMNMLSLLCALSVLYPCSHCAQQLQEDARGERV
ncbi:hypothetical protein C8Q80DRAFT_1204990 [Daedaleopsis nitida]|nr:hypothetical protein C8Q80DRAFT_1204990 [Daedaleopsis nitida]